MGASRRHAYDVALEPALLDAARSLRTGSGNLAFYGAQETNPLVQKLWDLIEAFYRIHIFRMKAALPPSAELKTTVNKGENNV